MAHSRQGVAGEICWVQGESCGFRLLQPVSSLAPASMLDALDLI